MAKLNEINQIYKTEQGDQLALEELVPVIKRYGVKNPHILEPGCGYGRNVVAMSSIEGSFVEGCDIEQGELEKAKKRAQENGRTNVKFTHQSEGNRFPYEDNQFDVVASWQVLEHILDKQVKKDFLTEATRVVKGGGIIVIETPNQLFPFDYHDNNLPFLHWFGLTKLRYKLTRLIRDEDFPPSQYINIYSLKKILKKSPHVKGVEQLTKIYFEESYSDIFKHMGGTRLKFKKLFFTLYFPFYLLLRLFRLPGDSFTPSLRVVFKVKK